MWFDCTKTVLKRLKIAFNNSLWRFMFLPWHNGATEMFVNLGINSFDEISHNSPNSRKYILCNVYRLPCYLAADIDLFNAEFCSLLRTVKHRNSSVLICGDFNIDLLSVTSNRHVTEYFDNVISSGFFPK